MKSSILLLVLTVGVCSAIVCDQGCVTGELKEDGKKYDVTKLGSPACSNVTKANCTKGNYKLL